MMPICIACAAQRDDIGGGVGRAAGDQAAFLEFQHRDGRFAAQARCPPDQVFVEDHVAEDDHALSRQLGDEFEQMISHEHLASSTASTKRGRRIIRRIRQGCKYSR